MRVLGEATTSWSYVGPGLRLSAELLGPEYSMQWSSLDSGLRLFFSRAVKGSEGEDLVEKQNAETGMMPVRTKRAGGVRVRGRENRHIRPRLSRTGDPAAYLRRRVGGSSSAETAVPQRGGEGRYALPLPRDQT
jgi:hypothetical protein